MKRRGPMQDEYRKDFDPEKKPLEDSDIRYAWSDGSPVRENWTGEDERKYEFTAMVMEENLEHARHVENERMEFHTVFIAFISSSISRCVSESGSMNTSKSLSW